MNSYHQTRDTTFTKIFVGGLPYHTTDDTLQKFFEPFGSIEEAVVITDRQTGKSRGYGFVTMSDRVGAERACKDPNPIIDGRKANVNLAYLGAKPRIPVGELIAAFPFGLKTTGPAAPGSYLAQEIMGFPQIVYPSTYLSALPTAGQITLAQPQLLQAPLTTAQLIDYSAALGASPYSPSPLSGYESALGAKMAAYPYMTGPAAAAMAAAGGYLTAASSSTPPSAVHTYAPLHLSAAPPPQQSQTFIGQFVSAKQLHNLHQGQDRLQ